VLAALVTMAVCAASSAAAQQTPAPAPAAPAGSASADARDPKAMAALEAAGRYLRSLKTFDVRADAITDEVMTTGQKLQFGGTIRYRARLPDRLRAEVRTDRVWRDLYYDGSTLTQYAPRMKYYATAELKGTVGEFVERAERDLGVEIPLADLFLWGTDRAGVQAITSAQYVGPARIGGRDCEHFAFRQEGVDWQVWLRKGSQPLPCKFVITTLDDPAQPQFAAVLDWNVAPSFDAGTFRFAPPKDARRIPMNTTLAKGAAK
jgi:hypothetical protein